MKKGQKAKLSLGYDGNNKELYLGRIVGVKPETPFLIEMEDEMWTLKQKNVSKAYPKVSLNQLLRDIITPLGIVYECSQDINLGKIRIEKTTIAKVLEMLKDNYGIYSFFIGEVLHVGTPNLSGFDYASQSPIAFDFQKDIPKDSASLSYVSSDDRKLRIDAVGFTTDNKVIKATIGEQDGEVHTLHYYGITEEAELRQRALADQKRMQVSGYKGVFTAFGTHIVKHGNVVSLKDNEYPEREGNYRVESVKTTFGLAGFRQEIELGARIS
ncbi:MAG: hypothetical protein K1X92_08985 [Bacteroidia bacterium]|nr:hypothetical protein [Bacteroidia bacterium]